MKNNITLTLPNNKTITQPTPATLTQIIQHLQPNTPQPIITLQTNNQPHDPYTPITQNTHITPLTWHHPQAKKTFWQTTAHLLATAIQQLHPTTQPAQEHATTKGFYHDIDLGKTTLKPTDLPNIEKKMHQLAQQQTPYKKIQLTKQQALQHYKNNPYKQQTIEHTHHTHIQLYQHQQHTHLAHTPLLPNTNQIKIIKLHNISAAYWQNNPNNKQLTRITGISYPNEQIYQQHQQTQKQAQQQDHRKLGKQLQLFTFSPQIGPGLPLWLPKGTTLRQKITQKITQKLQKANYQIVTTPHIAHTNLYNTSGHTQKYGQHTFQPIQTPHKNQTYQLKPMNCPHHCQIYKNTPQTHHNLPLRLAEFATVYRYEPHGQLNGLMRTRSFTQEDGHIFCTPQQIQQELINNIKLTTQTLQELGLHKYKAHLSLQDPHHPHQYIGTTAQWKHAQQALIQAAQTCQLPTTTQTGEAAFYGPKIDFTIQDNHNRHWQLSTLQLDYQLPQRLNLTYTTPNNTQATPTLIHRTIIGSLERLIALLLEHTAGHLPPTLHPQPITLLTLAQKHTTYAQQIAQTLHQHQHHTYIDTRQQTLARKIHDAQQQKIPYIIIIGDKETQQQTLTLRTNNQTQHNLTTTHLLQTLNNPHL